MAEAKPSKSAQKRAFIALQELGEQLLQLSDEQLAAIEIEPQLLDAVREAQKMRAHGALRRQKQLIGKIMRNIDPTPIQAALDAAAQQDSAAKSLFRESEEWRDRITEEGQVALSAFVARIGRQNPQLEKALRDYAAAHDATTKKHVGRRIFRHVHHELTTLMQKAHR